MGGASDDQDSRDFLAALNGGDVCHGTASAVTRSHGVAVTLDGFPALPLGTVGPLDVSWRQSPSAAVQAGQRITAEVVAVDQEEGRARMSMAATENPELWGFLASLQRGEILSGTVAAIERFGVFVQVADGIEGLIHLRELTTTPVEAPEEVVQVGDEVSVVVIEFDRERRKLALSRRQVSPDVR